jgi:hypothetical protein
VISVGRRLQRAIIWQTRAFVTPASATQGSQLAIGFHDIDTLDRLWAIAPSEIASIIQVFMRQNNKFKNKIAPLIQDVQERRERASRFKVSMLARGFKFEYFTEIDDALEWLSI